MSNRPFPTREEMERDPAALHLGHVMFGTMTINPMQQTHAADAVMRVLEVDSRKGNAAWLRPWQIPYSAIQYKPREWFEYVGRVLALAGLGYTHTSEQGAEWKRAVYILLTDHVNRCLKRHRVEVKQYVESLPYPRNRLTEWVCPIPETDVALLALLMTHGLSSKSAAREFDGSFAEAISRG